MKAVSLRRGVAWIFAGRMSDQVLTFAFGVVLARLLTPEDFGMLLTIQVFTGLVGFVAGGGMGQALVQAKAVTPRDFDVVFTLQLLIGGVIYAGFYVVAPAFARWYGEPLYADLLRLSALSFVFRPLVNMPSSALYRAMQFKTLTGIGIATLSVSSATSIGMAWLGYGVWSLVWGGIVGSFAQSLMLMHWSGWRPALSFDFARARELARYGMLVAGNDVVDYLRSRVSIFILSQTLGAQSVGLYNKGDSLARMPFQFVSGSVYQVLFRALSAEQDNLDKCRYLYNRSLALVALYATPFYVGLFWLAEPLVRGVYGPRWAEAAGPLVILAFAWPFWLIGNLSGAVAASHNRLGVEIRIQLATLVLTAAAIWFAVPYGIDGVARAVIAAIAVSSLLMFALALRTLHAHWYDSLRVLLPAAALNTVLAVALATVSRLLPPIVRNHDLLHVAVLGGVGGLVYAAMFLFVPLPAIAAEQARWRRLLRLPLSASST